MTGDVTIGYLNRLRKAGYLAGQNSGAVNITGGTVSGTNFSGNTFSGNTFSGNTTSNTLAANVSNLVPSNVFAKYRLALNKTRDGVSDTRVFLAGDSTSWGTGTTLQTTYPSAGSWPARLASFMNTTVTPAVLGLAATVANGTDTRFTYGTGWVGATQFGFGSIAAYHYSGSGGGTLTFTPSNPSVNCDGFYVYYMTFGSGGGSFNATATGGSATPVNTNDGSTMIKRALISGTAGTSNSVVITPTGTVFIVGIEPVLSTKKQVIIDNGGVPTATAAGWANSTTYNGINALQAVAPDLTIISLGINDSAASSPAATFQTNMQTIITAAKASGDVLLCSFPPSSVAPNTTFEPTYIPVYQALATANNCAFLDFYNRLGGSYNTPFMYDAYHPNNDGYWDWGQFVANFISNP